MTTRPGPGVRPDVATVVDAVLGARSSAEWNHTVFAFGPHLMIDTALAGALRGLVEELRHQERPDDARTLSRWLEEVDRRIEQQKVMDELLRAGSDDRIDELLDRHSELVKPRTVERAFAEVDQLIRDGVPYPFSLVADNARTILGVSLRIALRLGDTPLQARCRTERGAISLRMGDFPAAAEDLDAAATVWERAGYPVEAGRCLSLAGDAFVPRGLAEEALARFRRALELLDGSGKHVLLAATHEDVARILLHRGEKQEGYEHLETAATHRLAAGAVGKAVERLSAVVAGWLERRETARALAQAERLVAVLIEHAEDAPKLVDPEMIGLIRSAAVTAVTDSQTEGQFLWRSANPEASEASEAAYTMFVDRDGLALAERWHAIATRAHALSPDAEGAAMLAYAGALLALSSWRPDRAVEQGKVALQYFEGRGARDQVTAIISILAQAERARGNLDAELNWYDRALARNDDEGAGSYRNRTTWLTARAGCLRHLGRAGEATDDLREAIEFSGKDRSPLGRVSEGAARQTLGWVYESLGDVERALEEYRRSLELARLVGHRRGEAAQLHALGGLVGRLDSDWFRARLSPGELAALTSAAREADPAADIPLDADAARVAVALLERAGGIYRAIGYEVGWTQVLTDLSNLVPDERPDERLDLLTAALVGKREVGDRLGEAVVLANLGVAYERIGRLEDAVRAFEESLAISRAAGAFESASQSARDLAHLRRVQGDLAAAEAGYADAVHMIEAARVQVPRTDRHRVGFIRNKGSAYLHLVDLLVARGAHDEAFEMVQRAKSRAMLEAAGAVSVQPTARREGRFEELLELEEEHLAALHTPTRGAPGSAPPAASTLLARLDEIYSEMRAFDPDYVSMRRGTPATVAQLRAWLAAQDRPVLLAEYFVGETGLTIFFLRAGWTGVEVYRQSLLEDQLWERHLDLRRRIVDEEGAPGAGWASLSASLVQPLVEHLEPGDLVYLVPHRVLHGLPLHAFTAGSRPLIAEHPVAYAPASGLLPLVQNDAKGTGRLESCASFGVVFEEEARQVAELFGAEPISPAGLRADAVEALCVGKDICHFSCHGYFDPLDPLSSGVVLQDIEPTPTPPPGAVLTARRVMNLRLQTELVCLSACESAMSQVTEGDELLGLTRAFLHAGASSIVATLWPVDAETTRGFMVNFYRHLRDHYEGSARIDKAAALRKATLQIIEAKGEAAPFHWAPFVLTGDWR